MESSVEPREPTPPALNAEVAALENRATAARSELARVLADLADAQKQLGGHQMHQLLEANEQLVVDAVRSREIAESAAQLVNELTRSTELDVLTGLPNRLLLVDRFTQALTHAKRHDSRLALLFLDVDQFKQINDTLGHKIGDDVLRAVGHCLNAAVREVDTVCRLGGDEFVLLLTEVTGAADPGLVAEKLLASLDQLTQVNGVAVRVSASIGISVFPDDAADVERLVDCADQAMYRSKRAGGNCYHFFSVQELPAEAAAGTSQQKSGAQLLEANENLVLSAMAASAVAAQKELLLGDLQNAARNKDEFLSVLGHELRNPLAPLVTTLDVLRLRGGGHETLEHATMRRHIGHLVRLVDDLQDIAKIATGKVTLRLQPIQIGNVAAEAIAMARPLLEQRHQRFVFNEAPHPLTCRGDPVRLEQCIANLLINAAKYTPAGGTISLTTAQDGEQAVVTVKDDGRGIAAEALPQVFNLFFQERGDGQLRDAGLGVGLALVRSLVGLHSGSVSAHSDGVGLGSEFVIRLPLVAADKAEPLPAAAAAAAADAQQVAHRRILIVDDNYDAADSLCMLLRMYGHEVWVATHPVAALQMLANATPDLALLDIGLPGMDGYELARQIRQQHPGLQVALVALSGYGRAVDRANSLSAGFAAHLTKPVHIDELEQVLRTVHFSPPDAPPDSPPDEPAAPVR